MWIRVLKNKMLTSIYLVSLLAACSKGSSGKMLDNGSLVGGEPTSESNAPVTSDTPTIDTGEAPSNTENSSNTASPLDILKSITGAWSSTCRDTDSKKTNTSEKDIIKITLDPSGHSITLYTVFYSASRSCEKHRFQNLEEHTFVLSDIKDGHQERDSALAIDLIDGKISLEKPQNVLLVFANPENSEKKGRILFEVFDTQRTSIRLQIDEWRSFLPSRMKDQDSVTIQLESIVNAGGVKNRNTPYTKSQAFSRSLDDDLDIIED